MVVTGLDISYLLQYGKINWEHRKNPEDIIGEPIRGDLNPKRFYIRAKLYKGMPRADSAWLLLKATEDNDRPVLGWSVEGKVLARDPRDPSRIVKAMVANLALTANPVNGDTFADLVKAMSCGGMTKGLDTISGSALIPQSLEGSPKRGMDDFLKAYLTDEDAGCGCHDAFGRFIHDYPGALRHFHDCLGAPITTAAALAGKHRHLAELYAKRSA